MPGYRKPADGQWVWPVRKGYRLMCCDCGLVHNVDFRVVRIGRGHKIQFRMSRNNRSTASARKRKR